MPKRYDVEVNQTNQFANFLELSENDKLHLVERIKKWNGIIRIFVHPLYIHYYPKKAADFYKGQEFTKVGLERVISLDETRTPAVIIFEEHTKVTKMTEALSSTTKQKVYIVKTEESDPDIHVEDNSSIDAIKSWFQLRDYLVSLGVKKILIGGQFSWIDPNELRKGSNFSIPKRFGFEEFVPEFGGCVGKTINLLNDSRFQIELSNFAYPHSRNLLRQVFLG